MFRVGSRRRGRASLRTILAARPLAKGKIMRARSILGIALISVAIGALPVWANGDGGGGGGGMGGGMPSMDTPSYDPAKEYQAGVTALKANDFKTADRSFDHVLS